ncbi:MAG: nucleotidyl transferase AbiEii/AbiGii toxin family protein [Armatimonadota bacterium]
MRISRDRLMAESESTGFRPEILEKVIHLLSLLEMLNSHPQLKGKLVLKGGTALNLFMFEVPRLSVDLDFNYIGSLDRQSLEEDRPLIERAITAICGREGYVITRSPSEHAGGKFRLRYESAVTPTGILQLDLNFMLRVSLWPVAPRNSFPIGSYSASGIPMLDVHEIAAGKFAALLSRRAARDLYDSHHLLQCGLLDADKLRLAFVIYGAINRKDWRTVKADDIGFEASDLENQLIPVLRADTLSHVADRRTWAQSLVDECRLGLSAVLPLQSTEREFLDLILDHGDVRPELLTTDCEMQERICTHPGILWKALNVRKHKVK